MSATPSNKNGSLSPADILTFEAEILPSAEPLSFIYLRTHPRAFCLLVLGFVTWFGCEQNTTSPLPSTPPSRSVELPELAPSITASVPSGDQFQFTSLLAETGIGFRHESGDSPMKAFPAANGSGIGVLDFDRDGFRDLLFLTNNPFEAGAAMQSNGCYRNRGGFRFTDVSQSSGLGFAGYSAGVAIGDFNSDGFSDVYLNCYGENQLFENCGDGTFLNVSQSSGTNDDRWGTSAAFLDIDNDGLLDLYVGNYAQWTHQEHVFCGDQKRNIRMYCSPKSVSPESNVLYHNSGDGTFSDVSQVSGILSVTGRTQGVLAVDLTNDALIDLYITNDLNPNTLFVNQGNGQFQDQANLLGVAYDYNGVAQAGMGVACADANRDGLFDLFVTNFEGEHNAYYEQEDSGFFGEVSHLRGLAAASIPWIGWGTVMADFDLDGWPDVFVINGHTDTNMHEMGREGDYRQPPLFWRNDHGKFVHVLPRNSPFFEQRYPGRGLAISDLDNDLDGDVLCGQQNLSPEILRNDSPRTPGTTVLQLQLIGQSLNRDAVGAVVRCRVGDQLIVEQVVNGGSYLSASDSRLSIVIPSSKASDPLRVEVAWGPNDRSEVMLPNASTSGIICGKHFFALPE